MALSGDPAVSSLPHRLLSSVVEDATLDVDDQVTLSAVQAISVPNAVNMALETRDQFMERPGSGIQPHRHTTSSQA